MLLYYKKNKNKKKGLPCPFVTDIRYDARDIEKRGEKREKIKGAWWSGNLLSGSKGKFGTEKK